MDPYTIDMTPWPDLAILELLVKVSDHGSVGSAARALSMPQPTASRALSTLEKNMHLTLLQRTPRGSTLTTEGILVVEWARGILDAAAELVAGAQALQSEPKKQINIGASMTVAEYLVPKWLGDFRRRHPEVDVSLQVHNSKDVFELVQRGGIDLGFVESPEVPNGLGNTVIAQDKLVVVTDRSHPWAERRDPITVPELAATPLVVREPGSGTRTTLDQFFREFSPVSPALELGSNAAVRVSVAAGTAPGVLSELAVESALGAGELVAIQVEGMNLGRELRAVWRTPRLLSGPALELVQIAISAYEEAQAPAHKLGANARTGAGLLPKSSKV